MTHPQKFEALLDIATNQFIILTKSMYIYIQRKLLSFVS